MQEAIAVIQEAERAVVVLHPLRIAILERLTEPKSPAALSPELGVPRQHVNYHMRELEAAGLVELVEERKKGNCVERVYRSVARSFVIAPGAMGAIKAGPGIVEDRESSDYLVALGARLIDDLATLRGKSQIASLALEGEIAFASEADRGKFAWDLARMLSDLASKYHTEGGRKFRIGTFAHPAVAPEEGI
jgi:DNA-binding transcriptional ArsR family regulator